MSALHDKLQSQGFDILAFPCNQARPDGDIAFDDEPCATPATGVISLHLDQD